MADILYSNLVSPSGTKPVTKFTDSFNRASGQLGLNWGGFFGVSAGNGTIGYPGIGACTDALQGVIVQSLGGGGSVDGFIWCSPLVNSAVNGKNQFSQWDLISETGAGSFCGPSVAVNPQSMPGANFNCYSIILRNGQWRLIRLDGGGETQLIAPAVLAIPCTLKITCVFNGAINNIVTVFRNGVQIGTVTDVTGTIIASGVPGFTTSNPGGGSNAQWRNFSGGTF